MMSKLHQLVAVVGVPQLVVIVLLSILWVVEQWLAYTKRVKANATLQAFGNALLGWAKLRWPLVLKLSNLADQISIEVKTVEKTTTATATIDSPLTPAETPSARTKQAGFANLTVLGFIGAVIVAILACTGCAPGTDGLRQSCTNAENLLAGAYPLVSATAHADLLSLRSTAVIDATKLHAHEIAFGKALSSLDAARSSAEVICAAPDAIDAGAKGDVGALEAQLAGIFTSVTATIASIKDVL